MTAFIALWRITRSNWCCCASVCMYSCLCTYGHYTWTIVIVDTPLVLFTAHPGHWFESKGQRFASCSGSCFTLLFFLPNWETEWVEALKKGFLNNRRYSKCFSPANVPSDLFDEQHLPPVWLLSHDLFCGAPFFFPVEVVGFVVRQQRANKALFCRGCFRTARQTMTTARRKNIHLIPVCWLGATISAGATHPDGLIFMTLLLLMFSPGW